MLEWINFLLEINYYCLTLTYSPQTHTVSISEKTMTAETEFWCQPSVLAVAWSPKATRCEDGANLPPQADSEQTGTILSLASSNLDTSLTEPRYSSIQATVLDCSFSFPRELLANFQPRFFFRFYYFWWNLETQKPICSVWALEDLFQDNGSAQFLVRYSFVPSKEM